MIIGGTQVKTGKKLAELGFKIAKKFGVIGATGLVIGVCTIESKKAVNEIREASVQMANIIKNELSENNKEE